MARTQAHIGVAVKSANIFCTQLDAGREISKMSCSGETVERRIIGPMIQAVKLREI